MRQICRDVFRHRSPVEIGKPLKGAVESAKRFVVGDCQLLLLQLLATKHQA